MDQSTLSNDGKQQISTTLSSNGRLIVPAGGTLNSSTVVNSKQSSVRGTTTNKDSELRSLEYASQLRNQIPTNNSRAAVEHDYGGNNSNAG